MLGWLWLFLSVLALFFVLWLVARFEHAATDRSQGLMKAVLDEREYKQLLTRGFLDIHSPTVGDRIYRVRRCGGTVSVYEHGSPVLELCVQPAEPLPNGDVVVLHKLMIEANESQYLATAKQYPPLPPRQRFRLHPRNSAH